MATPSSNGMIRQPVKFLILVLFLIFWARAGYTQGVPSRGNTGEALYKKNCVRCHGPNGARGFLGAKNLKKSTLADSSVQKQIQQGKGFMPAFREFSSEELIALIAYVKKLRG